MLPLLVVLCLATVEGLPSDGVVTGRRLAQLERCEWDAKSANCVLGDDAFFDAFRDAESDYARFLHASYECERLSDAATCDARENCLWLEQGGCQFVEITRGRETSPCVSAPGTVSLFTTLTQCPLQDSQAACQTVASCEWDASTGRCVYSEFLAFYGYTTLDFNNLFEQTLDAKLLMAVDAFDGEFSNGEGIDSGSVLSWKVPETVCPDGTGSRICVYVDALLKQLLPTLFYCQRVYADASPSACDADLLCRFDQTDGRCTNVENVSFKSRNAALDAMTSTISNPTDRRTLERIQFCSRIFEASACSEPCAWDSNAGLCSLSLEGVAQILSEGGGSDGLCSYFSALASAGCASLQGQAACLQNQNCNFEDNVCVVGPTYFTDAALDKDPELVSRIEDALDSCLQFQSPDTCAA